MKKTKRIIFRLGDKDLAIIDQMSKADGVCRSEFIRRILRDSEIIPAPDVNWSEYVEELRRLGCILNEVVKKFKATGILNTELANDVWEKIIGAAERLKSELIEKTIGLKVIRYGE